MEQAGARWWRWGLIIFSLLAVIFAFAMVMVIAFHGE